MKIRVSNIDRSTMEEELLGLFEEFGEVSSLSINEEPDPGLETFTAWVEMPFEVDAEEAIEELNGERVDGRLLLVVSEAEADKINLKAVHTSALDYLDIEEEAIDEDDSKVPLRKAGREGEAKSSRKPPKRGGGKR